MLKKYICVLATSLIIMLALFNKPLFSQENEIEYYTLANSNAVIYDENCSLYQKITAKGQSASVKTFENALAYAEKFYAKEVLTEETEQVSNYYYYSKKLSGYCIISSKKVNLHISVSKNGKVKIGSPIIFGSY